MKKFLLFITILISFCILISCNSLFTVSSDTSYIAEEDINLAGVIESIEEQTVDSTEEDTGSAEVIELIEEQTIDSTEENGSLLYMHDEDLIFNLDRYALVIGNGAYDNTPLANPVNDAQLIKNVLEDAGFDVFYHENLDSSEMSNAVSSFVASVNSCENATAVLYYAGHGIEIDGVNYLIPTDNANLNSPEDVKIYAYSLDDFLSLIKAPEQIIMLDACRDNPYSTGAERALGIKGGLGAVRNRKNNVTMSYLFAAQSGATVKDGEGGNSVFTAILAEELGKADLPVYELFNNVAARVKSISGGTQIPLASSTGSKFVFQSEELSLKVLKKWQEELKNAEMLIGNSNESADESVSAIEMEARKAFAAAEIKAAEERAERLRKQAEIRENEAKLAFERSNELQSRIEEMKIAAENANLLAKTYQVNLVDGFEAIAEINRNIQSLSDIVEREKDFLDTKIKELETNFNKACKDIDTAPYKKAELNAEGKPTEFAIKARTVKKQHLKENLDSEIEHYQNSIIGSNSSESSQLLSLINDQIDILEQKTYIASSEYDNLHIILDQYDGDNGGWMMHISTGQKNGLRDIFKFDILLPYEDVTDCKMFTDVESFDQITLYETYLEQVDMFDTLFRSQIPIIKAEIEYEIETEGGSAYVFIPLKLIISRTDNNKIILEKKQDELSEIWGSEYILNDNIDIRTEAEKEADLIDVSKWSKSIDGYEVPQLKLLSGSMEGNILINEWCLSNSDYAVLPFVKPFIKDNMQFYGWNVDGKIYKPLTVIDMSSVLEKPSPVYAVRADVQLTEWNIKGTDNGDSIISPGEKVYVEFNFLNNGKDTLENSEIVFSSDSPYIKIVGARKFLDKLIPSETVSTSKGSFTIAPGRENHMAIEILPICPENIDIPLNWRITGNNHPGFDGTITIPVRRMDSDVTLEDFSVIKTTDGDDVVTLGETACIDFAFYNYGESGILMPTLEFSTSTPGVKLQNATFSWSDLKGNSYLVSSDNNLDKISYSKSDILRHGLIVNTDEGFEPKTIVIDWELKGLNTPVWKGSFNLETEPAEAVQNVDIGTVISNSKDIRIINNDSKIKVTKAEIESSSNDDKVANPNETIHIVLYVKNTGSQLSNTTFHLTRRDDSITFEQDWAKCNWNGEYTFYDNGSTTYNFDLNIKEDYDISKPIIVDWKCVSGKRDYTGSIIIPVVYPDVKLDVEKTKVYSSTYKDGNLLSPGETCDFSITMANKGDSMARIRKITFYVDSPDVKFELRDNDDSTSIFWYGQEISSRNDYTLTMRINDNYDISKPLKIYWRAELKDGPDQTGVIIHPVEYTAANIILEKSIISNSSNGDRYANPGEKISLDLYTRNIGNTMATVSKFSLSTETSNVTFEDNWSGVKWDYELNLESGENEVYSTSVNIGKNHDVSKPVVLKWKAIVKGHPDFTGFIEIPVLPDNVAFMETNRHFVVTTGSGDRKIDIGESVDYLLELVNTGNAEAKNAIMYVYTTDPSLKFDNGKQRMEWTTPVDIPVGGKPQYQFRLVIPRNYDLDNDIRINWILQADDIPDASGSILLNK